MIIIRKKYVVRLGKNKYFFCVAHDLFSTGGGGGKEWYIKNIYKKRYVKYLAQVKFLENILSEDKAFSPKKKI